MNIKQAKEQIRNTLRAYLDRDALGNPRIPAVRQRPVLLMGPPGIGKTQIAPSACPLSKSGSTTGSSAASPSTP